MNKRAKGLMGGTLLAGLLSACGSLAGTGDGSASLYVSDVRTEYRDAAGNYVACDTVADGQTTFVRTTVATYFTLAGSISSVNINLRGNTDGRYDSNFSTTFYPGDLTNAGASSYKATFVADAQSGFLPQSVKAGAVSTQGIVVNPVTTVYVKRVVPVGTALGSFASVVTLSSTSGRSASGTATRSIPVYSGCNILSTTGETL